VIPEGEERERLLDIADELVALSGDGAERE
jgi:hypothetical protein